MGLAPKIDKKKTLVFKTCNRCGQSLGGSSFAKTTSIFYPDGLLPICNDCVNRLIDEGDGNWEIVDKLCQYADIPFVPKEWERVRELSPVDTFYKYSEVFLDEDYESIGWGEYFQAFSKLKAQKAIEDEIPLLSDEKANQLREKWGANYDDYALNYLENLYIGLNNTQNIAGALQIDQALKICKMSYEIDCRIRAGEDFDKILSAYDKTIKAADFTPKNAKNANDFESVGEVFKWLEKKGWKNGFYDNVTRDVVDETIKNIQAFNQRLYTEESGIGDEITRRIEALKSAKELEDDYYITATPSDDDLDKYSNDGFDKLFNNDDFDVEVEE